MVLLVTGSTLLPLVVLVYPLVVLVYPLVVLVFPLVVLVCPLVVSVCRLVALVVLSVGLFITDHLPCFTHLSCISLMSTKSLLHFHEKEMLKRGRICEKFSKRKLERNVVTYLIAGKILRSTEIKFEMTESELSLLLKNNVMHVENSCE